MSANDPFRKSGGRILLCCKTCAPSTVVGCDIGLRAQLMRRRDFISIIGGAAAWPLAARAEQPAMPIMGFLAIQSSRYLASRMPSFRQGLKEAGYIEGQNVAIEYRLAEGHYDRLPDMLADLIGRQVATIVTSGIDPSKIAKAATTRRCRSFS